MPQKTTKNNQKQPNAKTAEKSFIQRGLEASGYITSEEMGLEKEKEREKEKCPLPQTPTPKKEKDKEKEKDAPANGKVAEVMKTDYYRFLVWATVNIPYCAKNLSPPTEKEFWKLKDKYGTLKIMDVASDLENRKDLRKRYSSMYRTLIKWLKNTESNGNENIRARQNNKRRETDATATSSEEYSTTL